MARPSSHYYFSRGVMEKGILVNDPNKAKIDNENRESNVEQENVSENKVDQKSIGKQIWKSFDKRLNKLNINVSRISLLTGFRLRIPGDPLVTLNEVIEAHEELEAEAEALLGGANANVCTYPEGYKPRQPLYSCRDCTSTTEPAALCYACSVNCHDGHELVELYTKRNFCCDCGNSKFKNACTLYKEKKPLNERNKYNHNFNGLYCTCNRPYPCEEYDDCEMLQCIVCEDWFHLQHLEEIPDSVDINEVEEVICRNCVTRFTFLLFYADGTYKEICDDDKLCKLKWLEANVKTNKNNQPCSLFFNSYKWRNRLCHCKNCSNFYEDNNLQFLTDLTDCMQTFVESHSNEDRDKSKDNDRVMTNALIDVAGREGAITLFKGYEEMKQKLGNHLKRLANEGREVKKEDIDQFFQELEMERKRRREDILNIYLRALIYADIPSVRNSNVFQLIQNDSADTHEFISLVTIVFLWKLTTVEVDLTQFKK
ncbi:putative E3 ubiquitin-protein ligase [Dirofilaria immitis]